VGWTAFSLARGQVRWEFFVLATFGLVLPYVNERTKTLYLGLMPAGFVAILYDAMTFVQNVGLSVDRVHVCDLRNLEMRLFGTSMNGHPATIHDWFQAHATLRADVFFSVPYATYLEAIVAYTVFAYAVREYDSMRRFTWCFFLLSVLGFVTYHVYPAAPPWYYHARGCVADLTAHASEGPNLARVDAWSTVHYFHAFYGRSSNVFGAIPSLHVAYPLIIVLEGWSTFSRGGRMKWPLRIAALLFWLWMCVAAVYLDHHWVTDLIVGLLYCVTAFLTIRVVVPFARRHAFAAAPMAVPLRATEEKAQERHYS
jgi:hypothetical protein